MNDSRIILAVVILLGLVTLVGLGGVIYLVADDAEPTAVALVSTPMGTALGALAALLAQTRTEPDPALESVRSSSWMAGANSTEADLLRLHAAGVADDDEH